MRPLIIASCALTLLNLLGCGNPDAAGSRQEPTSPPPTSAAAIAASAQPIMPKETTVPTEVPPASRQEPGDDQHTATPGSSPAFQETPIVPTSATISPAPTPPNSSVVAPPLGPALQTLVDQARADLAGRQSVALDAVELVELRIVVWPDGGLGCPQPGMVYPQVQVDGYLIRLRSGDQIFNYHGDGIRPPFLCEQKSPGDQPAPAPANEST